VLTDNQVFYFFIVFKVFFKPFYLKNILGKWANQTENNKWNGGPVPLESYPINDDSNAQIVKKKPKDPVKISQNVKYKFLKVYL
jgi:hypothetical protein